jgi:predicted phosphodiesterase
MRVAIFSDVHGNLTALEAVLADICQYAPDLTYFAGDLCQDGARPSACVQRIREAQIPSLYGNTDEELVNQPLLSRDVEKEEAERDQQVKDMAGWTRAQLSEADLLWLGELPFHRRVSPTVHPKDDLLIVHANPRDVDQHIYPPEAMQKTLFGKVKQPDDDPELRDLLQELSVGILAFGHYHVPSVRHWGDLRLANISSVSLPVDGDRRAKYGLFTWRGDEGWQIEHHHVEYDVEREIKLLTAVQPPEWQSLVQRLQTARPTESE